ncbi:MAG TPA: heterodisulfide reductase-related iron-sulfur binding cluster [Pyrinomonadaceae bacterium]|nr:heterodisulfide reductase-related iron-sulfur binding cluster [Pyrinomonadaceae bacterium]
MSFQFTSQLAAEEQKLLACIHCGLCLEACPTYVVTGDENDGPRGRLYLMRAVGEGQLANDSKAFERHVDRCLGCRACEQVCPAGVEYGQLLEAARGDLFTDGPPRGFSYGVLRLLLKYVWLHPSRLKLFFTATRLFRNSGLARLLLKSRLPGLISRRAEFGLALLVSSSRASRVDRQVVTNNTAGAGQATMMFTGCVGEGLFEGINEATTRVLAANGWAVSVPERQVCCGALHAHAGDLEGARTLAKRNIEAFENGAGSIITNAGGCGAMLVSYGHLLERDEQFASRARKFSGRVRDVSQHLETATVKTGASVSNEKTTYDASCHLLYGQHAGQAPLNMLAAVADLNFVKLEGSERCCGGAGIYNLLEPDLSRRVLEEKLHHLESTGATVLATGNAGCQMQIGAGALLSGMDLKVCHPIELLDQAYEQAGFYEES